MIPELEQIMTFKGIHALCTVDKSGKMKAVYYACCLVSGPNPLWGIWRVGDKVKFIRFCNSKQDVADNYPAYSWRRVMARWKMQDDKDSKAQDRRRDLAEELGKHLPGEKEVVIEGAK